MSIPPQPGKRFPRWILICFAILGGLFFIGLVRPMRFMSADAEDRLHTHIHQALDVLMPAFLPALAVLIIGYFLRPTAQRRLTLEWKRSLDVFLWLTLTIPLLGIGVIIADGVVSSDQMSSASICMGNLKKVNIALQMYIQDWNETFPPIAQWGDLTAPRLAANEREAAFHCPAETSAYGYAINKEFNKIKLVDVDEPAVTVLLFDSNATTRNAAGGKEAVEYRHFETANVSFVDSHARRASRNSQTNLRWSPYPPKGK